MSVDKVTSRLNPWLLCLAALLFVLFAAAGFWQVKRAHYKESLQVQTSNALRAPAISIPTVIGNVSQLNFRKLSARGSWIADKTIFIDNKVNDGVIGYHVVTPLRIEGSQVCVLVNRGWVAAPRLRGDLPQVPLPAGAVEVSGIARLPSERFIELADGTVNGRVWQNLTMERFRAWSGLALQPVIIYQENPADDGLVHVAPAPEAFGIGADRHRGYALMWFSLAALTFALSLITLLKALKSNDPN